MKYDYEHTTATAGARKNVDGTWLPRVAVTKQFGPDTTVNIVEIDGAFPTEKEAQDAAEAVIARRLTATYGWR